jgi:hypothetical protein
VQRIVALERLTRVPIRAGALAAPLQIATLALLSVANTLIDVALMRVAALALSTRAAIVARLAVLALAVRIVDGFAFV